VLKSTADFTFTISFSVSWERHLLKCVKYQFNEVPLFSREMEKNNYAN